jgi:nucleoside-diphosphate-sugar epimerase
MARDMGVKRYVLASSCSIYGFQDGITDEFSRVNPLTTYAKANLAAERDVLALSDPDFCVVVLRQATVYGLSPRMRFDLAINGMVKGLFERGSLPILRDGRQWRPFVHVKDTSRAMILALRAPSEVVNRRIFNVGSDDQNYQIMPLARMIAEALDIPFNYEWYGMPDHRSYRVSFERIARDLGFIAECSPRDAAREIYDVLESGLIDPNDPRTNTVQWYRNLIETQDLLREVEMEGVLL